MVAALAMAVVYGGGTLGYFILGHGKWSVADCAYMTVISLTTVGYGEVLDGLNHVPFARLFTSLLLVSGAGIAVYFVSVLTTFLVEGEFLQIRRRRKMKKQIDKLSEHIIVCGIGGTGKHVVRELVATQWPFVAIDTDPEKLARCQQEHGAKACVMEADATDDNALIEAGIKRAHGIVASLPDDQGNLYVVITARGLNPNLRVVAKAMNPSAVRKLQAAGSNAVVSVNKIGGLRLVSEMIRPHVVTFLDRMLRDQDRTLRFEEVTIPSGSPLVNKKLAESDIRTERNLLIVAARSPETNQYTYSPGPQFLLEAGMTLIIIGETSSVQRLRQSRVFRETDGD